MANNHGYIGRAPGDAAVIIARQNYTSSGVTTDFTFTSSYTPGYLDVYLNGVRLVNVSDYTAGDGSTVGLTSAAQNGDTLEIVAYKAFNVGNVTNATGNFDVGEKLTVSGISSLANVVSSGIVTADYFYGDGSNLTNVDAASGGSIGLSKEGTVIGVGATQINFASSTGGAMDVSVPSSGLATVTVTPGASIGLAIALGG